MLGRQMVYGIGEVGTMNISREGGMRKPKSHMGYYLVTNQQVIGYCSHS